MEKMTKVTLKNGKDVTIFTQNDEGENSSYYTSEVFDECNNKIGFLRFKLSSSNCYLIRIEITDNNYAHVGLGSKMIEHMEDMAFKKRCFSVDGRFYPFGELGKHARNFYEKHNYSIYKDGYETYIYKNLENINKKSL